MGTSKLAVKRAIKSAGAVVRPLRNVLGREQNSVRIFAYHRVVADIQKAENEAFYGLVVSTETFRKHCQILKDRFDVVSLEDVPNVISGRSRLSRPAAVITFDDGYLDFYEEAFPVLRALELPATVFLPTEFIGKGRLLDHDRLFWLLKLATEKRLDISGDLIRAGLDDKIAKRFTHTSNQAGMTELLVYLPRQLRERVIIELEKAIPDRKPYPREFQLLNWDQVREMADANISFGGHTANHVVLPVEDAATAGTEISASKSMLEEQLGREVTTFAYPNGEHNAAIRQITRNEGFSVAVTTKRHANPADSDLLSLGRFSLCEESTRGLMGTYSAGVAALRFGV